MVWKQGSGDPVLITPRLPEIRTCNNKCNSLNSTSPTTADVCISMPFATTRSTSTAVAYCHGPWQKMLHGLITFSLMPIYNQRYKCGQQSTWVAKLLQPCNFDLWSYSASPKTSPSRCPCKKKSNGASGRIWTLTGQCMSKLTAIQLFNDSWFNGEKGLVAGINKNNLRYPDPGPWYHGHSTQFAGVWCGCKNRIGLEIIVQLCT